MNPAEAPWKVMLVDDHTLFREGMAGILATDERLRIVGEAENGERAIELAQREKPDVVLLDIEMPGLGAKETFRCLRRVSPGSRIMILTMHDEAHLVRDFVSLGARAYVVKSATREELLATIHTVTQDPERVVLSVARGTLEKLEGRSREILSRREMEVLSLVAGGLSNLQIASHLYISEGTVKRHLTNVYAKLGVASRVDAINKANAAGLIIPSELPETDLRRFRESS